MHVVPVMAQITPPVKKKRPIKQNNLFPLSVAGAALTELMSFIEVSVAGLKDAAQAGQILQWNRMAQKVLGKRDPFVIEEHYTEAKRRAERLEAFAKAEGKYEFPYLFGIAASRLWTIAETMVDDLIAYLLQTRPECRQIDIVRKLEGPLVEFVGANEEDRARYLANLLTEQVKARFKLGIGRFEAVLNQIGLGGPVDSDVQKTILELSQIRHVIIHRLGKADERLVASCPWLNLKPGQPVRITQKNFRRFYLAVFWYMLELDRRFATLISETTSEFKTTIHQQCRDELRTACSTDNRATEAVLENMPLKHDEAVTLALNSSRDRNQKKASVVGSDVPGSNELRDILLKEDRKELKNTAHRIKQAKQERVIIVTAHRFAEKLVSDIIAARLLRPYTWLRNADYVSKVQLGKALGILGPEQYSICCVLGSAQIALDRFNSLPQDCKAKIRRIAYAHFKKQVFQDRFQRPFDEIIRLLLAILSATWLEARFKKRMYDLRKRYRRQWSSLFKKTLWANLDLLAMDADSPENQRAIAQVDLQLVKDLRAKKKL